MHRLLRVVSSAILVLIVMVPTALTTTAIVSAQRGKVEPNEVALKPADLPPGFTVSKEESKPMEPGPGVFYSVMMERPITTESASTGPVLVGQFIGRFDGAVGYAGLLDEIRRRAMEQDGFEMVPGAPNDGGTASLQKFDGQVAAFEVGFIKRDMVIFTRWFGHRDIVTLQGLLTLAGVSSARYDQVLAGAQLPPSTEPAVTAPVEQAPAAASQAPPSAPPSAPTKAGRIANTGGSGANLRSLPHSTSELLQVVNDGESISILGVVEAGSDGRQWHNVKTAGGVVGWVVAEYVAGGEAPPPVAAAPAPPPPPPPAPTATRTPPPPPPATATPAPAPRTAGSIDNRIMPALRTLYGIRGTPPGSTMSRGQFFRSIVEDSGVRIEMASLSPGNGGYYRGRTNTITMSSSLLSEDTRTVAVTLAHELIHVAQALIGDNPNRGCVDSEVEAFKISLITFGIFYDGLAPGRTSMERTMNAMYANWSSLGDPWLYRYVVDLDGYQDQCRLWVP